MSRKLLSLALFSLLLLAATGTASAGEATGPQTTHLIVDGMSTPNCPVLVKAALRKLDGVRSVEASLETKRVSVTYEAGTVTSAQIATTLQDQVGLTAEFVEEADFAIEGMATPNCPVLVKKAVASLPGVLDVDASLQTMSATVVFVAGRLTPDEIAATILDRVGLQATLVPGR